MENIYAPLHSNQKLVIYEMLKRGIDVEIIDYDREIVMAHYKGHDELLYDRDSSITPYSLSVLAGDKAFTKKMLERNGVSVPIGIDFYANEREKFYKAFDVLSSPVVIKPIHGSHGDDVYTDIRSISEVDDALDAILAHSSPYSKVLIEEYFKAREFRVFITTRGDYAILERDPAHIYGNGIDNIKKLIDDENYRRMHPRVNSLCEIVIDKEAEKYLNRKNISLYDIPKKDEKVYLRDNSNIAKGGVSIDRTDEVHPTVLEIGKRVLSSFPGIPYLGIDFMTEDISKEQNDDTYRIIEINTVPGVDMHYRPALGKSRNISKYIVDLIYPETRSEAYELKLK